MDLSRYAALFVTETREQLSACGQALLEWERNPAAVEPVVSLFRAMHTFKGMAAAMGYSNLTELAHRTESMLDVLRSDPAGGREQFDLFFRVVDALEQGAAVAIEQGDSKLDFTPLLAELDEASVATAPTGSWAIPVPGPAPVVVPAPIVAGYEIRVTIRGAAMMKGARALLAVRKVEALGTIRSIRPPLATFELELFDGRFTMQLESAAPKGDIEAAIRAAGDVDDVVFVQEAVQSGREGAERGRQIRIDLRRLDAMMNQVGELVVAKGRLVELAEGSASPELRAVAAQIGRVTADLHGEVVQARMTPVWQVFDRFPRVVRDLARQLGRRVRFEVEGEETQLDRAILDELGEPLIHLLRNAVDHGIETPAERVAKGKPEEGLIRISASSDRTTVQIRVSDDGAGIDRARMLNEAIRLGLLPAGSREMADDVLLKVLTRPGFTTAERVTEVSGRGIGMDAVVSRLRALGGSVEIATGASLGSSFTLRLPMTLAIIRALLARVGEERYAIPLSGIAETVEFHPDRVASVEGREAFVLRDALVPTVRLRERLGVRGVRPVGRMPAVIVEVGGRRAAVVVDALVGQQEIVVEPFDAPTGTNGMEWNGMEWNGMEWNGMEWNGMEWNGMEWNGMEWNGMEWNGMEWNGMEWKLPVFSGATILGDGIPALIVDPAALV